MSGRGSVTKRQRRKGVVWEARWYEDGKQRSKSFNNAADAKAFLNNVLAKLARGETVSWAGSALSLREWSEVWMQRPLRPSTASRDRNVMERWWLPALGTKPLSDIKRIHVQGVIDEMAESLSPVTVRTHYGVMRACMAAAVAEDLIGRTPCRAISLPQQDNDKAEIRFLEPHELDALANAIGPHHRALIYVAGVCGLRWSECVGLQVRHLTVGKITVERTLTEVAGRFTSGPTKTKAGRRTITMPSFVAAALAQHLQRLGLTAANADELVFPSPTGEPLRRSNFRRRVFDPAVKTAKLDGLTFHGLRHTAAGLMIAGGYSPAIIQRRLGHASIRTTYDVYGHLLPSADATVAAGLERMWGDQATAEPSI